MPRIEESLRLLGRKSPLSDEEWQWLVQDRCNTLKKDLDRFTLKTLGETTCLRSESHYHAVGDRDPKCFGEFGLQTQGIFRANWLNRRKDTPILYIWGLTRKAQWIVAAVHYSWERGYKDRGFEYATEVQTSEAPLATLVNVCKVSYLQIWQALGEEVQCWVDHRKILYESALQINRLFAIQDLMLEVTEA